MLHELLLALLGHCGGVVMDIEGVFKINPTLEFISSQERTVLDQLLVLGSFYSRIRHLLQKDDDEFLDRVFSTQFAQAAGEDNSKNGSSIYVRALAEVIEEQLQIYESQVLAAEEEYLRTQVCNLGHLAVKFSEQYVIFPEIILLLESIEERRLRGGKLLELLYINSRHGSEIIRKFYVAASTRLYKVLASQLITWVLYGRLEDAFGEFFISKNTVLPNAVEVVSKDEISNEHEDWNTAFTLRDQMLPRSLIPRSVADKILFIGKYVRVVTKTRSNTASSVFSPHILKTINSLSEYEFAGFQEKIETIRAEAGKQFLSLFLREENILEHLVRLKDYYLLGRGEFFQVFIEESQGLFKLPPKHYSENDLNSKILPSVLMKLNWPDAVTQKLLGLIRFCLTRNGFEYRDLGNTIGLSIGGSIEASVPHMIRFRPQLHGPTAGSVFHSAMHTISSGFELSSSFKFHGFIDRSAAATPMSQEERDRVLTPTLEKLQPIIACNCVAMVLQSGIDPVGRVLLTQHVPRTP